MTAATAAALGELSGLLGVEVVGVGRVGRDWLVSVRVPAWEGCGWCGGPHPARTFTVRRCGGAFRNPARLSGWLGTPAFVPGGPGRDPAAAALTASDGRRAVALMWLIAEEAAGERSD